MRIKTRFPPSRRFAEVQEHKRGFCHIFSSVLLRLLRVLGQCLWTRVSISLDTFFLVLLRSLQQNWRATPRRRKQSTRPARAATNCKRNIVHPKRSLQTIEVLTSYLYKHLKYEHLTSKMGNSVDPDSCFSFSTGSCDLETSISLDRVLCIDWKRQPLTWAKTCLKVWRLEKILRRWDVPLLDLLTMLDLFIRLLAAMKALPWRTIAIVQLCQIWIRMGWQNRLIWRIARFALNHPILSAR